ncbi:MAG: hypothetical protein IPG18_15395 [Saprospiraceae bacterium]|nr:hypothetical protein [Saprospiraceae bacterium]
MKSVVKLGEIKGFNVWKRTYATNVGGENDYTVTFTFATLDRGTVMGEWKNGYGR